MYAALSDMIEAWGNDELLIVANDGTGAIDQTKVNTALMKAQGRVDSKVGVKYPLPLPQPTPQLLTDYTCDIAMYLLSTAPGQGLTEQKQKRYDEASKALDEIALGSRRLAVAPDPADNDSTRISMSAQCRQMTSHKLREIL